MWLVAGVYVAVVRVVHDRVQILVRMWIQLIDIAWVAGTVMCDGLISFVLSLSLSLSLWHSFSRCWYIWCSKGWYLQAKSWWPWSQMCCQVPQTECRGSSAQGMISMNDTHVHVHTRHIHVPGCTSLHLALVVSHIHANFHVHVLCITVHCSDTEGGCPCCCSVRKALGVCCCCPYSLCFTFKTWLGAFVMSLVEMHVICRCKLLYLMVGNTLPPQIHACVTLSLRYGCIITVTMKDD